jgi:hypothetical protein
VSDTAGVEYSDRTEDPPCSSGLPKPPNEDDDREEVEVYIDLPPPPPRLLLLPPLLLAMDRAAIVGVVAWEEEALLPDRERPMYGCCVLFIM